MKTPKMLLAALIVVALTAMAVPSFAANNTETANATATIQGAIAIVKDTDLAFGKIVAGDASVVKVTPEGAINVVSGTATLVPGATVSAAAFDLTGTADATYAVVLPSSCVIQDGASNEMTVDTFTKTGSALTGTTGVLLVGANLNVGVDQIVGTYTGTFDVSVYYN